jgi:acetylornithine deacetylase/succinyl-diaminopimelate desuccinylase-like protein
LAEPATPARIRGASQSPDPGRYAAAHQGRTLARLAELIAFRTVSAARHRDLARCAGWLAGLLRSVGMAQVRLHPGRVAPVVTAARRDHPEAPTVLVYAHYDVQPADRAEGWATDPFQATRSGSYLYARGASDDKGQLMAHLAALEAWLATTGRLPVNVVLVLDGEEEIGSPTLLSGEVPVPMGDLLLVSDTRMRAPDQPVLVSGLRGSVSGRLTVTGAPTDLHAGGFGGAVPDPAQILCRLVASLHHPSGRIAVDGFHTGVPPHAPDVLAAAAVRPAIVVTDLGTSAAGRTVVPARATARLNVRLVGSQDPARAGELLRRHLAGRVPASVRARLALDRGCPPYTLDPSAWPVAAVQEACRDVYGRPARLLPSGGSIPFVNTLAAATGLPALLLGFGLPDDGAHAANERLHLPSLDRGIHTLVRLYGLLGTSSPR